MRSASILDIFKCWGIFVKYLGFIPMDGVYEGTHWPKRWTKLIFMLLTTFTLGLQMVSAVGFVFIVFLNDYSNNITDILKIANSVAINLYTVAFPIIIYFQFGKKLVVYINSHIMIEPLLKPNKRQLTYFANIVILIFTTVGMGSYYAVVRGKYLVFFNNYDKESKYYDVILHVIVLATIVSVYTFYNSVTQPQAIYISCHQILKTAFEELNSQIKLELNKGYDVIETAVNLRRFGQLYFRLGVLCNLLDDLVNPLLLIRYGLAMLSTVLKVTFMSKEIHAGNLTAFFGLSYNSLIFILPVVFATKTSHSASNILPTLFCFDLNKNDVKREMDIIALQSLKLKRTFTASGILKLNGYLIISIIETIVSYGVIFYKINNIK